MVSEQQWSCRSCEDGKMEYAYLESGGTVSAREMVKGVEYEPSGVTIGTDTT